MICQLEVVSSSSVGGCPWIPHNVGENDDVSIPLREHRATHIRWYLKQLLVPPVPLSAQPPGRQPIGLEWTPHPHQLQDHHAHGTSPSHHHSPHAPRFQSNHPQRAAGGPRGNMPAAPSEVIDMDTLLARRLLDRLEVVAAADEGSDGKDEAGLPTGGDWGAGEERGGGAAVRLPKEAVPSEELGSEGVAGSIRHPPDAPPRGTPQRHPPDALAEAIPAAPLLAPTLPSLLEQAARSSPGMSGPSEWLAEVRSALSADICVLPSLEPGAVSMALQRLALVALQVSGGTTDYSCLMHLSTVDIEVLHTLFQTSKAPQKQLRGLPEFFWAPSCRPRLPGLQLLHTFQHTHRQSAGGGLCTCALSLFSIMCGSAIMCGSHLCESMQT